jgi:hypothetical protein
MATPTHPDDGFKRQDFSVEVDRNRLSEVALKAYCRLAEEWDLTERQAAGLLDVSMSTWERMHQAGKTVTLSQDQLTRISALLGIQKGLQLLFADAMADRWPLLPNNNALFAGASPAEAMIKGGIPLMLDVRRLVEGAEGAF